MTTAQAAAYLGITANGVQRLILRGRLRATRFGERMLLIRRSDLMGFERMKAGRKTRDE